MADTTRVIGGTAQTRQVFEMIDAMRAVLEGYPKDSQAAALGYMLAALVGEQAETMQQAIAIIEITGRTMIDQIACYGVGTRHP